MIKKLIKTYLNQIYINLPDTLKQILEPKLKQIKLNRRINFVKANDISKKNLRMDFVHHERYIKQVYGEVEDNFCEGVLPHELLLQITDYLKNKKPLSSEDVYRKTKEIVSEDHKLLCTDTSSYGDDLIKNNSNLFNPAWELDHENEVVIKLQKFIAKEFKEYFKSPIIFVNSRAWALPPNSEAIGPSAFHLDGFEDGHLKIMIYPLGLSDDLGKLVIEDKEINNRKKGTVIPFKNSDAVHMSIPGQKEKRITIEITIMRSIIPSIQRNKSHFNGRHFHSIKDIYEIF